MLQFRCNPALPSPVLSCNNAETLQVCWCRNDVGLGSVRNPGLGIRRWPRRLLARLQHDQSLGGAHEQLEGLS